MKNLIKITAVLAMIVLTSIANPSFSSSVNQNSDEVSGTILTVNSNGNAGTVLINCGDGCAPTITRFVLLPFGTIVIKPGQLVKGYLQPGEQDRVVVIIDIVVGQ